MPDTTENRDILQVCERYRRALESRDKVTLIAVASPHYWEEGVTAKPDENYGYDGLRQVIEDRVGRLKSIRFEIEYREIEIKGRHATVHIYIDASYELAMPDGSSSQADKYRHKADYSRIELEHDGKRWLITGGM